MKKHFFAVLDQQERKIRNGFVSQDAKELLFQVAEAIVDVWDTEASFEVDLENLTVDVALSILDTHEFSIVKIPSYIKDLIEDKPSAVVSNESQYFFDGSLLGVESFHFDANGKPVFLTPFEKKVKRIKEALEKSSVFIQEVFSDWLEDMDLTDWDYFEQPSDKWQQDFLAVPDDELLSTLEKFRAEVEEEAYKEGYLPENKGMDVREWSTRLHPLV